MFRQVIVRIRAEDMIHIKVKTANSGCRKMSISAGITRRLRSSGRILRIMVCRISALTILIAIIAVGKIAA